MMPLSPLDKQIVMGAYCGALDRTGVLADLADKLERQRAPVSVIRTLRETVVHLGTIENNLRDVASRMEG